MIRPFCASAVLAVLLALPALAGAEPQKDVADAFMAAAKTQDRKATLSLLAADVSVEFPTGRGEGQPFVIGYLDGLFDADRGLSLDSAGAEGDSVRFLAHEDRTQDRYAIEVEIRNHQVVKVTVNPQRRPALADLSPAS